ncbi:MAG: universal stress protein [Pseudomonadales bacterium]
MDKLNCLLVLVDDNSELQPLLEKARTLQNRSSSGELPTELHILRVIYDPTLDWHETAANERQRVINSILDTARQALSHQVFELLDSEVAPAIECTTIWGERAWEEALLHATSVSADLIIKAEQHEPTGIARVRTPEDWNLLRHSRVPVLLCGNKDWHEPTAIVVAIDGYDLAHERLNRQLLRTAKSMAQFLSAHIHVVSCYPAMQPWLVELGGLDQQTSEHQSLVAALGKTVSKVTAEIGLEDANIHLLEGKPSKVIADCAQQIGSTLVIVGTHARSGIGAAILGNTAESLIHHLDEDVLVVSE